jgi:hypothetical protein
MQIDEAILHVIKNYAQYRFGNNSNNYFGIIYKNANGIALLNNFRQKKE